MKGEYTKRIPNYGVMISVQEWRTMIKKGLLEDVSGYGAASDGKKMTKERYPVSEERSLPEDATHIVWFNT